MLRAEYIRGSTRFGGTDVRADGIYQGGAESGMNANLLFLSWDECVSGVCERADFWLADWVNMSSPFALLGKCHSPQRADLYHYNIYTTYTGMKSPIYGRGGKRILERMQAERRGRRKDRRAG